MGILWLRIVHWAKAFHLAWNSFLLIVCNGASGTTQSAHKRQHPFELSFCRNLPDDPARISGSERPFRDVPGDNAASADDGFRADFNARADDSSTPNPNIG